MKKTNAQLQGDGSVGTIQVGGVLLLPESIDIESQSVANYWEYWSNTEKQSVCFGPLSAEYSVQVVTLQVDREAFPSSVTVYAGGNRGRGQLYPDGTASNLNSQRVDSSGLLTTVSAKTKRYGNVYGMITENG